MSNCRIVIKNGLRPQENLPGHVLRSAWAKGEDQVPPRSERWWCLLESGRKPPPGYCPRRSGKDPQKLFQRVSNTQPIEAGKVRVVAEQHSLVLNGKRSQLCIGR